VVQQSEVFAALADPTRRRLVERLGDGPATVSELARPLPISLPAVVQHVQVLEASGLITTEKLGRTRECRIARDAVARVENWLSERRQLWESRFDRLGELLEGERQPASRIGNRRKNK